MLKRIVVNLLGRREIGSVALQVKQMVPFLLQLQNTHAWCNRL